MHSSRAIIEQRPDYIATPASTETNVHTHTHTTPHTHLAYNITYIVYACLLLAHACVVPTPPSPVCAQSPVTPQVG